MFITNELQPTVTLDIEYTYDLLTSVSGPPGVNKHL